MYIERCGFYDNGRIKTWLPYTQNADKSALIHEISLDALMAEEEDKLYVEWYSGPQVCTSSSHNISMISL